MNTPPPLRNLSNSSSQKTRNRKWSFKKILIMVFLAPILLFVGANVLLFVITAVMAFSKAGETDTNNTSGASVFRAANKLIISDNEGVYHGNSDEGKSLARSLSNKMVLARNRFFSESDNDSLSLTGGNFVTYCFLSEGSCAFLVRVPELRNFTSDAKASMVDLAWSMAFLTLEEAEFPAMDLAVGTKGALKYSQILVGEYIPDNESPIELISERDVTGFKQELFYPFFESILSESEQKILGTWHEEFVDAGAVSSVTYFPDRTLENTLTFADGRIVKTRANWKIDGEIFVGTITESSVPDDPQVGLDWKSYIIHLDEERYEYKMDGMDFTGMMERANKSE